MPPELLLLSSSRVFGGAHLEYARDVVREFFAGCQRVVFVPFAIARDAWATYTGDVRDALGLPVVGIHELEPRDTIESADAIYVGGGNSFRLLKALRASGLVEPIQRRVMRGELRYLGASAGSNMACPSLRTTNDMPIVQPATFWALGLVPFQINPHYVHPDPNSTHMGETREMRINEFLQENDVPVIGLREGAWLRRSGARLELGGVAGARLFRRGEDPAELASGSDLSWLLDAQPRFDIGS